MIEAGVALLIGAAIGVWTWPLQVRLTRWQLERRERRHG